ncbi:hypothetical protein BHM03_00010928 [Ensete ventricosum]|nr:hypothetical protein BHM03_00010928 [Ensete ventricosum]
MQKHIDAVERPSDREKKSLPLAISLDDLSLSRVGLGIEKRLIAASVGSAFFMARLGKQAGPLLGCQGPILGSRGGDDGSRSVGGGGGREGVGRSRGPSSSSTARSRRTRSWTSPRWRSSSSSGSRWPAASRCPRDSVTVSRDKSKITVTSEWRPSPSGNHKAFPVLCPNSDFILSIVGCIAFFFHWIGSQ